MLLVQLRLHNDVPYSAGVLLQDKIESGVIEGSADNYRLLSQAWVMAREDRAAVER